MLLLASGYIGYGGIILILAGGGGGQPVLTAGRGQPARTPRPWRPRCARRCPDDEPFEVDPDDLAAAVAAAGADPADDALVAAALVAWESLL